VGRRRHRKRERRAAQGRGGAIAFAGDFLSEPGYDPGDDPWLAADGPFPLLGRSAAPASSLVCGGCREFIEDGEGGRGTCLHPGSGILSPWTDTTGCDFHSSRRR